MKLSYQLTDAQKNIVLILGAAGKLSLHKTEHLLKSLPPGFFDRSIPHNEEASWKTCIDSQLEEIRTELVISFLEEKIKGLSKNDSIGSVSYWDCPDEPFAKVDGTLKAVRALEALEIVETSSQQRNVGEEYSWHTSYLSNEEVIDSILTEKGRAIYDSLKKGRAPILLHNSGKSKQAFVAMAFGHDDTDRLFDTDIRCACAQLDLAALRIDRAEPESTITQSMLEGIANSKVLLADLTYARPSVYFEVGFAQGLGIPIILMCRKDHSRGHIDTLRVHFDLEQYKISFWSTNAAGAPIWQKGMSPQERLSAILLPSAIKTRDETDTNWPES